MPNRNLDQQQSTIDERVEKFVTAFKAPAIPIIPIVAIEHALYKRVRTVIAEGGWSGGEQPSVASFVNAAVEALLIDVESTPEEGCPDCGKDSIATDEDGTTYCTDRRCGWRP